MKRFMLALLIVTLVATLSSAATAAAKPNVLFIVSDDLNNDLGCYGHPVVKTPYLDRLVERGMRFDRAYCQNPVCNPSRASLLSGRRPETTRVLTNSTPTRKYLRDVVMLPEYFRKNGYFTAQVGKIFHTGEGHEDPRSWDVEVREFGKYPPKSEILKKGDVKGPRSHTMYWAILKTIDKDTPDGIMARKAAELIEKATRDGKQFFVATGFRRPHAPYAAPKKYFDLYPAEAMKLPEAPADHYASLLPASINYKPPARPLTDKEQREVIAAYYACNSFVDAQVGVVLEALDRLKLWEKTVVVFLGDHGYHLGDHGGLWHKNSVFEKSARVPLIVYAPGAKAAGKSCQRLVELIDLYPTLTDLCGLPMPEGVEGKSVAPLLSNPALPWKDAAFTIVPRRDGKSNYFGRSVRTERWRYTEWDGGKKGAELYDYTRDPEELVNRARNPEHAETVARLRQLLLRRGKVIAE